MNDLVNDTIGSDRSRAMTDKLPPVLSAGRRARLLSEFSRFADADLSGLHDEPDEDLTVGELRALLALAAAVDEGRLQDVSGARKGWMRYNFVVFTESVVPQDGYYEPVLILPAPATGEKT